MASNSTESVPVRSSSRGRRWAAVVAACAAALLLSACGGGAYVDTTGNLNIGVTVAGRFVSDTPVASGGSLDIAVRAGETVSFDAGEPAIWTMYVGGSAVNAGAQVYYAGADIAFTSSSRSSVTVDTYAAYVLPAPIAITLVATSTYDSAQVATVNLLITD